VVALPAIVKQQDIGPPVATYTHANPAGSRHVDILMHLPETIRGTFIDAVDKRLRKLSGLDDIGDALHLQPAPTPGTLAKYVLRGIEPTYAASFHINPANEGQVACRRTGTSRIVGRTARQFAGWDRKASAKAAREANGYE